MDTVTLNSPVYGIKVDVPRQAILDLYPNSILAQALSMDPTVTTIDIPSPDVTPIALFSLAEILRNGYLPNIKDQLEKASYYLGTESLGLTAWPDLVEKYQEEGEDLTQMSDELYQRL